MERTDVRIDDRTIARLHGTSGAIGWGVSQGAFGDVLCASVAHRFRNVPVARRSRRLPGVSPRIRPGAGLRLPRRPRRRLGALHPRAAAGALRLGADDCGRRRARAGGLVVRGAVRPAWGGWRTAIAPRLLPWKEPPDHMAALRDGAAAHRPSPRARAVRAARRRRAARRCRDNGADGSGTPASERAGTAGARRGDRRARTEGSPSTAAVLRTGSDARADRPPARRVGGDGRRASWNARAVRFAPTSRRFCAAGTASPLPPCSSVSNTRRRRRTAARSPAWPERRTDERKKPAPRTF